MSPQPGQQASLVKRLTNIGGAGAGFLPAHHPPDPIWPDAPEARAKAQVEYAQLAQTFEALPDPKPTEVLATGLTARPSRGRPIDAPTLTFLLLGKAQPSSTTGLRISPIRSISTSQTSPCFMKILGSRALPTPEGVPMTRMSPTSRVKHCESRKIVSATPKIMSLVVAFCMTSPLRRVWMFRPVAPSGNSSAETNSGPNGPEPSKFLPTVHWVVRIW